MSLISAGSISLDSAFKIQNLLVLVYICKGEESNLFCAIQGYSKMFWDFGTGTVRQLIQNQISKTLLRKDGIRDMAM